MRKNFSKQQLILVISTCMLINTASAKFFGMDGYYIEKNYITKTADGTYSVFIDYSISGTTKTSLTNSCIVQKDSSIYQPIECRRDKSGNFVANYMQMNSLINTRDNTACILSIKYFDKSDVLLQTRVITTKDQCQWNPILATSSLDIASKYILKNPDQLMSAESR